MLRKRSAHAQSQFSPAIAGVRFNGYGPLTTVLGTVKRGLNAYSIGLFDKGETTLARFMYPAATLFQ